MNIFALRIPYRDTVEFPVAIVIEKDLESAREYLTVREKELNKDWKNAEVLWYRPLADGQVGPDFLGIYFK